MAKFKLGDMVKYNNITEEIRGISAEGTSFTKSYLIRHWNGFEFHKNFIDVWRDLTFEINEEGFVVGEKYTWISENNLELMYEGPTWADSKLVFKFR